MTPPILTPSQRRRLAAATDHAERTIRAAYEGRRIPLASTHAHLSRVALELGLPPPPPLPRGGGGIVGGTL